MSKLLAHFNAMQDMATRYLIPEPYVARDGRRSDEHNGEKTGVRDNLFAGDMIYMLDGPEQRAAEAERIVALNEHGWHMPSVNEGLRVARVCNGHAMPGDDAVSDSEHFPTEASYLAACRALHWRTEQLRQAGIEPLDLSNTGLEDFAPTGTDPLPHYPPKGYRFLITEAFPGDDHRQIYHAWRRYPWAMRASMVVSFSLGTLLGVGSMLFR